ncbi:MAG: NACHT domain-containing protein [Streptosporangiaceae bacterium]
MTAALSSLDPVAPVPVRSYEVMLGNLEEFYSHLSANVAGFIASVTMWDQLPEAQRASFDETLHQSAPRLAVGRYEELFRQLVADFPEFSVWSSMSDHQATRAELRNGLAGLQTVLESMASGRIPDQRRDALARAHRSTLLKPIAPAGEVPADLRIPALGEGYIDHRIRVAEVGPSSEPGRESWWDQVAVRSDACSFFAGYLTSPMAQEAPLVVLGQPGSGKSVLTRILAARLPASDFLPVRVELRQVAAESDLQEQIEFAVRKATGETLSWPRLVESGDGVLPVVMLDGFDELLQATGVAQTDFLVRVMAFQEREADQGRPLAVIVTSRTAVTDRARIPSGTVAVRLEPFDDGQVAAWLEVWWRSNAEVLAERRLRPLPAEMALLHRELAEQPLLLLMLALYDADTNALQSRSAELGSTELYGQLLREFARREIRKHAGALADLELEQEVDAELLRLSVVAFAMFNRRSQWVSESDLDVDLSLLLAAPQAMYKAAGFRAQLTAAQLAVGRFFFVHESQATQDDRRLQTYEFLHATFGEFLVAQLVIQILTDMLAREELATRSPFTSTDDGLLHAVLSFAALTARAPVIAFLGDLLDQMSAERRQVLASLLLRLHARALYPRTESGYSSYEPLPLTVTARHAAWSTNLAVLAVLAAGEITASQLFPGEPDSAVAWRNQAMMWRSQLSNDEWLGLHETVALSRVWNGQRRDVRLWRSDGTFAAPDPDIYWTYNIPPGHPDRRGIFSWVGHSPRLIQRKSNFTCGKSDDVMNHALFALGTSLPAIANVFVTLDESRPVSATHALLAALVAPYQKKWNTDSVYDDLVRVAHEISRIRENEQEFISSSDNDDNAYLKTALAVLISAVEQGAAPPAQLKALIVSAKDNPQDDQLSALFARAAGICPDL